MNGGAGKGHEYRRMIKYHTLKGRDAKFLKLAKEKRGLGWEIARACPHFNFVQMRAHAKKTID